MVPSRLLGSKVHPDLGGMYGGVGDGMLGRGGRGERWVSGGGGGGGGGERGYSS